MAHHRGAEMSFHRGPLTSWKGEIPHENVGEGLEICAVTPVEEGSRETYISATRPGL